MSIWVAIPADKLVAGNCLETAAIPANRFATMVLVSLVRFNDTLTATADKQGLFLNAINSISINSHVAKYAINFFLAKSINAKPIVTREIAQNVRSKSQ